MRRMVAVGALAVLAVAGCSGGSKHAAPTPSVYPATYAGDFVKACAALTGSVDSAARAHCTSGEKCIERTAAYKPIGQELLVVLQARVAPSPAVEHAIATCPLLH